MRSSSLLVTAWRGQRKRIFVMGSAFALECDRMAPNALHHLMYRSTVMVRISWADDEGLLREALEDKDGLVWVDLTIRSEEDASRPAGRLCISTN